MSPPSHLPPYSSGDQHLLLYRIFFVFFFFLILLRVMLAISIGVSKLDERNYGRSFAAIVLPLACGRSNLKTAHNCALNRMFCYQRISRALNCECDFTYGVS